MNIKDRYIYLNISTSIYVISYLVQTLQFETEMCRKNKQVISKYKFIFATILICSLSPDTFVLSKRDNLSIHIWLPRSYTCDTLTWVYELLQFVKLSGRYFVLFKSDIPKCSENVYNRNIQFFYYLTILFFFVYWIK